MAGVKETKAVGHQKVVQYSGNNPCFGCRKADGEKFYQRMKLRATFCRREWLCKECKQHYQAVGFTLTEVT